jgi:hypothetical protein
MQPSSPRVQPYNDPPQVRRILQRHRPFFIFASLALAALYAEEVWAANLFWGRLSPANTWLTVLFVILVVAVGNGLAFVLPAIIVRPEDFPRPVGAFSMATAIGIALAGVTAGLALLILLRMTSFSLDAAYILLKDVYVYTLVAVLFHGLTYYVRHMHWLYENFGGADSPFKPIAASVGVGAVIFIITIVFLPLDLNGVAAAPAALRGITGLHLYGRDLFLLTLVLAGYAWHLRWIADH